MSRSRDGYESNPNEHYPVLVVLDGEFEHQIAVLALATYTAEPLRAACRW